MAIFFISATLQVPGPTGLVAGYTQQLQLTAASAEAGLWMCRCCCRSVPWAQLRPHTLHEHNAALGWPSRCRGPSLCCLHLRCPPTLKACAAAGPAIVAIAASVHCASTRARCRGLPAGLHPGSWPDDLQVEAPSALLQAMQSQIPLTCQGSARPAGGAGHSQAQSIGAAPQGLSHLLPLPV